ncbi:hypothetical protein KMZ68_09770 [Bradyrhizobium sediminis]|uniref:Uncharacterized protein n=1 Tax=Bradyrhizobium sediminis TaxID=2840469 RepID=A0A975RUI9_9BRAD|nr:hypothetical protein [Bradyrhizobium sediminis]QWG20083.1 hypothetical protein KMZ68_09770 [Bradyrhizobium sediminis]
MNEVTARYARRFKTVLFAMLLLVSECASTSWAAIYQTGPFRSVCSSVEISAEPEVFQRFAHATVNEIVARTIEARLRTLGLTYPVLAGPDCLRERASAPRQLSLQFYARAVSDPEHPRRLLISLIMHSYYKDTTAEGPYHRDIPRAHHEFPTEVSFCPAETDPSSCLTDRVINYFDATMLKIIERAQELQKGRR